MAKIVKILLSLIAGLVGLFLVGAIALLLFFDPNDFRDDLSATVKEVTGRELIIEGELSVTVFPWLAVEIGRTTLGSAAGHGDEPFVSFEKASLSIELIPLITRQELSVGTIALDGLQANLVVARDGSTNWDDLTSIEVETTGAAPEPDEAVQLLDIAKLRLSDATIRYTDAQSGSRYELTGVTVESDRIVVGEPFDLDASFSFTAAPYDVAGALTIHGSVTLTESFEQLTVADLGIAGELRGLVSQPTPFHIDFRSIDVDMAGQTVAPGEIDLGLLGISIAADVERFSYADTLQIDAQLRVADFSLKELMQTLDLEVPITADPNAMTTVSFSGNARLGPDALSVHDVTVMLDDTTLRGELGIPMTTSGFLTFDLRADSINLDNYMAPASEVPVEAGVDKVGNIEIPLELIKALKVRGKLSLDEAFLGPMTFTNLQMGVNAAQQRLRLYPISAEFFAGTYEGDVRVDASGTVPTLSVNERIAGVDLGVLAKTVFETENIDGSVNGSFVLSGRGNTIAQIRRDLGGTMNFELLDGALLGTDVWHQLRSARAAYKLEEPPQASLPLRTEFSTIRMTGVVNQGVFENEDLLVEMPFLRITGAGTVDLDSTAIKYSVQARVLDGPEFHSDISEDELADFTQALIPIKIRGTLAEPGFSPDFEAMFREEVERAIDEKKDELKDKILRRLLGSDDSSEDTGDQAGDEPQQERDLEDVVKDELKKGLLDLLNH